MSRKIIFISWTPFGRHTELLGKALKAEIFFIDKFIKLKGLSWKLLFPIDYILKSVKSLSILMRLKPEIVFVQNPPSIAAVVVVLFSKYLKFTTVIDSHNGAFEIPWVKVPFHIWSLRNADFVTIHNKILFNKLHSDSKFEDINFIILNSKVADFSSYLRDPLKEKYFLIISTFSTDEPMEILLEGITKFLENQNDIEFKITGNYSRNLELYKKYSKYKNIKFLGFVDDRTYDYLIVQAFGIISLSTREDVQQFALMEAVGAQVPFISNRNATNVDLFENKMILVKNSEEEIEKGINDFITKKDVLEKNIIDIKIAQIAKWEQDFKYFLDQLKLKK